MSTLEQEILAYDRMREELEEKYFNRWVVVRNGKVACHYDRPEECLQFATEKFGRGPYLIRQVGAPPESLPVSALFGGMRARG